MAGVNLLFYYEGEAVTEDPAIREAWQQFYDRKDESGQTLCLVTGRKKTSLQCCIRSIRGFAAHRRWERHWYLLMQVLLFL